MHIQQTTKYLKDVTLQNQWMPFCHNSGTDGKCAQAKQWGWKQGPWPKKREEFCCTCLKVPSIILNLRSSIQTLWLLSTPRWTKLPTSSTGLSELTGRWTHTEHRLPHWDDPNWERAALCCSWTRRGACTEENALSEENEKLKTYGPNEMQH